MLGCDDLAELQCGKAALKVAIREYIASLAPESKWSVRNAPEEGPAEAPEMCPTRWGSFWKCLRCGATGTVRSKGNPTIRIQRQHHKASQAFESSQEEPQPPCRFDSDQVTVRRVAITP